MQTAFYLQKSILRGLLLVSLGVGGASFEVRAQTAETQTAAEEQNETFRDTLVRMRIKREEEEHKKIVTKAEQIQDLTQKLAKEATATRLREVGATAGNAHLTGRHHEEANALFAFLKDDVAGPEGPLARELGDAAQRLLREVAENGYGGEGFFGRHGCSSGPIRFGPLGVSADCRRQVRAPTSGLPESSVIRPTQGRKKRGLT